MSVVDSRASIRDRGLYARSSRHQKRDHSAPAPVSFDVIKSSFGGGKKDKYADTVLPEDSISCASSRRSGERRGERSGYERVRPSRGMSLQEYPMQREREKERKGRRGPASLPLRESKEEGRWKRSGAFSFA